MNNPAMLGTAPVIRAPTTHAVLKRFWPLLSSGALSRVCIVRAAASRGVTPGMISQRRQDPDGSRFLDHRS